MLHRNEGAEAELFLGQVSEEPLDHIEPRCGRKLEVEKTAFL